MPNKKLKKKRGFPPVGHYIIEFTSIIAITFLAIFYMDVGGYEMPIILAAMGAIGVIAGYDIKKRAEQQK